MKNRLAILLLVILCSLSAAAQYNNLEFVENKGQWNSKVQYMGDMNNGAFFLRKTGYTILQHRSEDLKRLGSLMHKDGPTSQHHNSAGKHADPEKEPAGGGASDNNNYLLRSHAYEMEFEGANASTRLTGDKPLNTVNNYFLGNDSTKWAAECKLYQGVTYENLYPNIDAKYFTVDGVLKYEFIVKPGGNPSDILMHFKGTNGLKLKNNELIIKTSVGDITELAPYTYQFVGNEKKVVDCRYVLNGNKVSFKLKQYDPSVTLVIDPSLIFATFTLSLIHI